MHASKLMIFSKILKMVGTEYSTHLIMNSEYLSKQEIMQKKVRYNKK